MIIKNCCTGRREPQLGDDQVPGAVEPAAQPMSIWKWIAALTAAGVATHLAINLVDRRKSR
jgi:hypothetical protein